MALEVFYSCWRGAATELVREGVGSSISVWGSQVPARRDREEHSLIGSLRLRDNLITQPQRIKKQSKVKSSQTLGTSNWC